MKFYPLIANDNYRPLIDFEMNKPLKNLMTKCLSPDPNQRPDFKEIFGKLCCLYGNDDSKSKLPPLYKDDDSFQKDSYCIDNSVNKTKVNFYIQKILVDVKPADLGKNDVDSGSKGDNDKKKKKKKKKKNQNFPKEKPFR